MTNLCHCRSRASQERVAGAGRHIRAICEGVGKTDQAISRYPAVCMHLVGAPQPSDGLLDGRGRWESLLVDDDRARYNC
jgi:hypothetical protein